MRLTAFRSALLATFALGAHSYSHASGFQLLEQNASGLGNAYAGSAAVAEDASTIFFNPAGMTKLQQREVSVGANYIAPSFKFTDHGSVTGDLSGAGSDAGSGELVPNAYAAISLTSELYFGLGVGAPFGLKTKYDNPWLGAAQSLEFDIVTKNLNPSLAWKASKEWSVGAGLNVQAMDAYYTRLGSVNAATGGTSTLATFDAKDSHSYGWNIGAIFSPNENTRIGASYRSKIRHTLTGTLSFTGTLDGVVAATTDGNAQATVTLPDSAILSLAHKVSPQLEMLADVSWTGWSSIPKVEIVRTSGALSGVAVQSLHTDFRDSWRVALGGQYAISNQWKLKLGTAWDQTPVKNAENRLVSLPDSDRVWLSTGAQWIPVKDSRIDLGLAYLMFGNADIDNDQSAAPNYQGRVTGSYEGNIYIIGLQYAQAF